jgi:hypothetical protein
MGRREITTAVTLLVLCGILVAGAVIGWQKLFTDLPDLPTTVAEPSPSCATEGVQKGDRLRSRQVVVSVFNAGSRSGLAGDTLDALAKRGFEPGEVGNAPDDVAVRRVQVRTDRRHDAEARLVALQFGKGTKVKVSKADLGPGVDVVVGNKFKGLERAKRSIKVRRRQQVCAPADRGGNAGAAASS